jgi:hypothetical protein
MELIVALSQRLTLLVLIVAGMFSCRTALADNGVAPLEGRRSAECKRKLIQDSAPTASVGHQYLLLFLFKKCDPNAPTGQCKPPPDGEREGAEYFGHPKVGELGCFADVGVVAAEPQPRRGSTGLYLDAESCPNDCVAAQVQTNDGADPLGASPWGIVSANDAWSGWSPRDEVVVWQVRVRDHCHARYLWLYHSAEGQVIGRLRNDPNFVGQLLVGYPKAAQPGLPQTCFFGNSKPASAKAGH